MLAWFSCQFRKDPEVQTCMFVAAEASPAIELPLAASIQCLYLAAMVSSYFTFGEQTCLSSPCHEKCCGTNSWSCCTIYLEDAPYMPCSWSWAPGLVGGTCRALPSSTSSGLCSSSDFYEV